MKNSRYRPWWFLTLIPTVSTPGSESEKWRYHISTIFWTSWNSWENRLLEIKFYDISWCQISSLVTPDTPGSLHTCTGSFSRSLFFWWILVDFWCFSGFLDAFWCISGVPSHPQMRAPGGECFAPPLPLQEGVPQVGSPFKSIQDIKTNRLSSPSVLSLLHHSRSS